MTADQIEAMLNGISGDAITTELVFEDVKARALVEILRQIEIIADNTKRGGSIDRLATAIERSNHFR